MTRVINIKITLLAMLFLCFSTAAIYAEGRLFKSIPAVEGLGADKYTTYDIARTGDGFIWFATDRGLIRFDGEHPVRIDLPTDPSGGRQVIAIAPTDDDALIAATKSGVFRIDVGSRKYNVTQLLDGSPFPATSALWVKGKFSLIGGDEGIVVFTPDGKSRRLMVGRDVLDLSNKVMDMAVGNGGVYLLTKGGVFRLDADNLTTQQIGEPSGVEGLDATSLAVADKFIYIGTSGKGIWRLDPSTGKLSEAFMFSKGNVVTSMKVTQDGSALFVGTDGGGITKISLPSEEIVGNARHIASDPISPSSNQVYSLYTDNGGHLWVGYYQNGIDYTPSWNGPFELIDDPAVFNTRDVPVRALSFSDGRITIGTREGLTVFERNCSTVWSVKSPALRSDMVISLLDYQGKTYIGTYGGGIQILDPTTRKVTDFVVDGSPSVFRTGHIFAVAPDKGGNLWVGTNQGLFRKSPTGELTHYTSSNSSLPDGNVYGIFFDSRGKGWICTDNGLCVYDPRQDKLRTDLFPSTFPRNTRFRTVYEDSRQRLHFVPENGMILSSNLDLSELEKLNHPLLEGADAKNVVEDSKGNLWIGTNRGMFYLDPHGHVVRFGLAAGLPSPTFLQGQPVADANGHIWFGNSAGLIRLNESEIDSSIEAQRSPVPTTLKVNGSLVDFIPQRDSDDGVYRIEISKASNTIQLEFSTFTYALEEPDAYLYSLDGEKWQRFPNELSLTFYELSPGSHELRVKSANDSDGESDMTVVIFHIPYPVWWYVLGGLILALLICGVVVWIQMKRHHKERQTKAENVISAGEDASDATPDEASAEESAPAVPVVETPQRQKYASNTLTRNDARDIARKVEEVMEKDKPYLQPDLKLGELAELVGISSHKMSQFFSQHKELSFYDYINSYRLQEFKRLVKEDKTRSLTLSALAEKAGFSSRASFFRYFKNAEGISPGEYIKNCD